MKITYICLLLAVLSLFSCHGKRLSTKNFMSIDNFAELNDRYINEENKLSTIFNIRSNEVDVMSLDFAAKDSLIISYIDTVGYKRLALKGKKKKNFFEIYFENTRIYLPPVFVMNKIDRVRIGRDEDEKLLIYKWEEHYGIIMPLVAGGSSNDEYQKSFVQYDKNIKDGLYAVQINDKWGYADREDKLVIMPIYDYAQPFKNGVAKVSRNNRWGFIDVTNKEIIPLVYDAIIRPEDSIMQVCKDGKWGLIDLKNKEIAAIKYDQIEPFGRESYSDSLFIDLAAAYKNDKIGFINKQGEEVIPVEYDEIELFSYRLVGTRKYYRTKLGNKYGYVSGNGVLCKPIFEKAGKQLNYNGFSFRNRTLVDKIGKYAEVIYKGEPYLFTQKGMLYKYKKLGFFKENRLEVDFDSGFYLNE